ncbi:MAG TPA: competence protein CoiA family protein [Chlamydiales bacterium]|nr:competence protein CoiA family protein [Chlamydiales bacterium]
MPLFATDGNEVIYAADADPKTTYLCLGCSAPVRIRRGLHRLPHFYHLQSAKRCHLYSKSEDHYILQLQICELFIPYKLEVEHPFFDIQRIADLIWEEKKIIFEIQCSKIEPHEAKQRIIDYRKVGYEVVWLLDDRIFNKKILRPSEAFLREQTSYFFSFHRATFSTFYDQCEVLAYKKRLKKGYRSKVHLLSPKKIPEIEWPKTYPSQIEKRASAGVYYFWGDLLFRALQAAHSPTLSFALTQWRNEEIRLEKLHRPPNLITLFLTKYIVTPYLKKLDWILLEF